MADRHSRLNYWNSSHATSVQTVDYVDMPTFLELPIEIQAGSIEVDLLPATPRAPSGQKPLRIELDGRNLHAFVDGKPCLAVHPARPRA